MKQTAKVMYSIGFIFNILGILFAIGATIAFGVGIGSAQIVEQLATDTSYSAQLVQSILLVLLIISSSAILIGVILMFLVLHARKNLSTGNGRKSTHTVLLVLGVIGVNIFYLLGGVFGIAAAGDDNGIEEDEE